MASNMLSRFLPPGVGEPSIYETLRQHDDSFDHSDLEERAGMTLDEENLEHGFRDYELDDVIASTAASQNGSPKTRDSIRHYQGSSAGKSSRGSRAPQHGKKGDVDDLDDEVPQSLLIEGAQDPLLSPEGLQNRRLPPPVPGPSSRGVQARWQAAQEQQQLHQDTVPPKTYTKPSGRRNNPLNIIDPKEKALWMWANVENLDNFLKDVYDYYVGNGIWCILLSRALSLL